MRITCLDISSTVGVAHGDIRDRPSLESWDFRKAGDRPDILLAFDRYLEQHFADHVVDAVFYEEPLPISVLMDIGASQNSVLLLRMMVGIAEASCARHAIKVGSWTVQGARQGVLGQGRFKKGQAKAGVMRGVHTLGYKPANDHEADALVGFLYQSALLNPRIAHLHTPLFTAAR